MYKLIILDFTGNILNQTHYLTYPDVKTLNRAYFDAVKSFKTNIRIVVEKIKYVDMGRAA